MGIFDALNNAVAGLQAQSFALQNISGNIWFWSARTRLEAPVCSVLIMFRSKAWRSGSSGSWCRRSPSAPTRWDRGVDGVFGGRDRRVALEAAGRDLR
jgi:hypothetical protein